MGQWVWQSKLWLAAVRFKLRVRIVLCHSLQHSFNASQLWYPQSALL